MSNHRHSFLVFFTCAVLLLQFAGCNGRAKPTVPINVTIKIESENTDQKKPFSVRTFQDESVLTAMEQARAEGLNFKVEGTGEAAFVQEINGLSNKTPGNEQKNWMFYINDKKANRSAGVFQLSGGEVILWKFETFDPNRPNE